LVGHTQTFISIGEFKTLDEANSLFKYIKSKFARALLGVLKITQDNKKGTWKYVPLQDFTVNSDIDWTQSVADIDRELYQKYDLSPEEIAFIENHVREMD
ncbi:restriction endonuclease, partial [Streptococcus pneumoniae]